MRIKIFLTLFSLNLLLVTSIVWFFPSTSDFRCDNPFWNGLSKMRSYGVLQLSSLADLRGEAEEGGLLVIPYKPFESSDVELLRAFLKNGGVLIIMDDYGYGDKLLSQLGIGEISFTHEILVDSLFHYKSPVLPRAIRFSSELPGVEYLTLNHASTLDASGSAEVLAWSSSFSYLDLDGDMEYDDDEPMGGFPVVARIRWGEGWVIAISDPSILINSMIDLPDNRLFFERLLELHGVRGILLDVSHLPTSRLDRVKAVLRERYLLASSPEFSTLIIALMLILSLSPIWFKELKGIGGN